MAQAGSSFLDELKSTGTSTLPVSLALTLTFVVVPLLVIETDELYMVMPGWDGFKKVMAGRSSYVCEGCVGSWILADRVSERRWWCDHCGQQWPRGKTTRSPGERGLGELKRRQDWVVVRKSPKATRLMTS